MLISRGWLLVDVSRLILPVAVPSPPPPASMVLLELGPALLLIDRLLGWTSGCEWGGKRGAVLCYMPGLATLPAHRRLQARVRVGLAVWDQVPTVHTLAAADAGHALTFGDAVNGHGGDRGRHRHRALPPGGGYLVGLTGLHGWLRDRCGGLRHH